MKKAMLTLFSLVLTGALLYSGFRVEKILNNYRIEKDKRTEVSQEVRKGRDVDFDALLKKNSDVKGWIYAKDTNIDYPILQADDNEFYLHRDIDKNYLYDGSIFIDETCENPFKQFNTVVYGHHMFSGAMFCNLEKWADEKFFNKHKIIIIETPEKSYDLHVIAFLNNPADSNIYTTSFHEDYVDYTVSPLDEDNEYAAKYFTKEDFIELIKQTAMNISDEEFTEDDTFVTLSTCAYNYDDARSQLVGILKEPALEDKTKVIETNKPFLNKWLAAQVGVGILMALSVVLLIPWKRKDNNK